MPLLVRSAIVALLWLFTPYWVFLLVALYFYFKPNFQPKRVLVSFGVFLALAALVPPVGGLLWYAVGLMVGAVFYLIFGVKDLIIVDRQLAYQALRVVLLLSIFLLFFWSGLTSSTQFIWQLLAFFVALWLLYREYFSFVLENESSGGFLAAMVSFLLFQVAWILAWLPIGFLNATAVMLLAVFMLNDFILHHYKHNLSRKILLTNFTVFTFSLLVIFLFSDWTIR